MAITIREALALEALRQVRVIAGHKGLDRKIRWVHIIDIPEILPWLRGGELLLTTGFGFPKDAATQISLIRALNEIQLAGVLFETGKFIQKVPPAVVKEADRVGLPILEAPYEVRFVDITEAIHRKIIAKQYEILQRAEEIHRVLSRAALEAEDLSDIARALASLIGKSVTIESAEFQLLAHCEVGQEMDKVRQETLIQSRTPPEVVKALEAKGFLDALKMSYEPLRFDGLPELGMGPRVVCPIRIAGEVVGYVWILEGPQPLSDLDLRAAEQAATLAALHILRQQAISIVESRIHHTFVDALIRGEFERSPGLRERARLVGFDPSAEYAVGILSLAPSTERGRKWALTSREDFDLREKIGKLLRHKLNTFGLPQFITYSLNQIIFLFPGSIGWSQLRSQVRELWGHLQNSVPKDVPLLLTVGNIHKGAPGVARSYEEADKLAEVVQPPVGVYFYKEHTLARLMWELQDHGVLRQLREETIGRLNEVDPSGILLQTLRTLIVTQFNRRKAARILGIHRNTVNYRIYRLQQIFGDLLEDPQFWAKVLLITETQNYVSALIQR
ncbi:MAG: PucR family transcriptional regulator ligand-binding domain-containing protein [Armatimonadota bacterium]|nr:PucR family transcriptional regulator ligand-binding domain-containing protein [Armatimonadota bacterium]MDR5702864.1 PucR family transcriptional regulator ligand-binding domain-containing protein [Armatimonadota bacterium]